jgi:type IV pilus assembly protein PilA
MRSAAGFTLIELMVVVAIIGVLATIAMPSYQDRVIRTQVGEGIAMVEPVRQAIADYRKRFGRMPKNNGEAGLPVDDQFVGNYVMGVQVRDGAITLIYGNRANRNIMGKKLTLRPAVVEAYAVVPIAWVCGNASVPEKMKVLGENATTLPGPHLPVDCR